MAARKLLAAFGLPEAVFTQSITALGQLVTAAQVQALKTTPEGLDALTQATLDWLNGSQRDGIDRYCITLADPLYPRSLLSLDDPPLVLYVTGSSAVLRAIATKPVANDIAMVGSRNPTPQGEANARQFATSLAASGLHIVSGLALGIDGAAHSGALDAFEAAPKSAGSTVAVVGTGLDRVYPKKTLRASAPRSATRHYAERVPRRHAAAGGQLSQAQPHYFSPHARHAGGRGRSQIRLADYCAAGG
jgi:DNA processing protein